jgi:hypothetical protein
MKREIEYCNWITFIDHGGSVAALPPDLSDWFDRLLGARERAARELSGGTVMVGSPLG